MRRRSRAAAGRGRHQQRLRVVKLDAAIARRRSRRSARRARSSPTWPATKHSKATGDRPDADAKALRDGWYFTGDTGYFDDDGDLFVTGRVDDMIISGGENISPVDIEIGACRCIPAVDEVAVAGAAGRALGPARGRFHQAPRARSMPKRSTRIAAPRTSPTSSGRATTCSSTTFRNRRWARSCAASCARASIERDETDAHSLNTHETTQE